MARQEPGVEVLDVLVPAYSTVLNQHLSSDHYKVPYSNRLPQKDPRKLGKPFTADCTVHTCDLAPRGINPKTA